MLARLRRATRPLLLNNCGIPEPFYSIFCDRSTCFHISIFELVHLITVPRVKVKSHWILSIYYLVFKCCFCVDLFPINNISTCSCAICRTNITRRTSPFNGSITVYFNSTYLWPLIGLLITIAVVTLLCGFQYACNLQLRDPSISLESFNVYIYLLTEEVLKSLALATRLGWKQTEVVILIRFVFRKYER